MPRFLYKAKSSPAQLVEGMVEAEDLKGAVVKVSQLGLIPVELQPESPSALGTLTRSWQGSVPPRWLAIVTRQLSDLLESGLTMIHALNVVSQQTPLARLRGILQDVSELVKGGSTLGGALERHPAAFNRLTVALVRAGETSGALEAVLRRLADSLEAEEELKGKIWGALTYPLFLSAVGLLTIGVLLGFVLPRLSTMFVEMGQLLPLPTRIVIGVSGLLSRFGWLLMVGLALTWFAFRRVIRSMEGKTVLDRFLLKIPVVGKLIVQAEVARFGRTLGTLLGQGIPILQALGIVQETLENEILRQEVGEIRRKIQDGVSMAQAMEDSPAFPVFVQNYIAVGETGGKLEQALAKVASAYEREVDRSVKVFTTLLEPALILIMGVAVGGIVMAMLLPIFQLNLMAR